MEERNRKVLGETMPVQVISVEKGDDGKYKTMVKDDDGYESTLYLDVPLPLGSAELSISHLEKPKMIMVNY